MPAISHFTCSHCGCDEYVMDHLVVFDGRDFVPLRHPGESYHLEQLGYREVRAYSEGRVFLNEYCVCVDCRAIVGRRSLRLPHSSQFPVLSSRPMKWVAWMIGAMWLILNLSFGWNNAWAVPLLFAVLLTVALLESHLQVRAARRTAVERAAAARVHGAPLQSDACTRCQSRRLEYYLRYIIDHRSDADPDGPALRCTRCDNLTLRYDPTYMAIA